MLHGKNVSLRPMERADIPRLWEFAQDMELGLVTHADGRPTPLAAIERECDEKWSGTDAGAIRWGIQARDLLIGGAELVAIDWRNRSAELAVWIGDHTYRQRGCGSDALRLALGYAFGVLGLHRVSYRISAPNVAALRCYESVGFVEEGRLREAQYRDGGYHDVVLLGVLRAVWRADSPVAGGEHYAPAGVG
jgi:RimJ/RimL family protein N-acetyltransferase